LNGYKKGLKKGSVVRQKDIIGYVGSTGVSTGPHLDYRIQLNGVFKNPFGIKFKAKTVLKDEELALFLQSSNSIAELFRTNTSEKILQVKNVTLTEDHSISFL
jgi:murein DD-endopeptidase MepM/ murein hydrolase activator NlpD